MLDRINKAAQELSARVLAPKKLQVVYTLDNCDDDDITWSAPVASPEGVTLYGTAFVDGRDYTIKARGTMAVRGGMLWLDIAPPDVEVNGQERPTGTDLAEEIGYGPAKSHDVLIVGDLLIKVKA
jgi:hypothetical protein